MLIKTRYRLSGNSSGGEASRTTEALWECVELRLKPPPADKVASVLRKRLEGVAGWMVLLSRNGPTSSGVMILITASDQPLLLAPSCPNLCGDKRDLTLSESLKTRRRSRIKVIEARPTAI